MKINLITILIKSVAMMVHKTMIKFKLFLVIGGPGSNKSTLCLKAVALNPGWSHFR